MLDDWITSLVTLMGEKCLYCTSPVLDPRSGAGWGREPANIEQVFAVSKKQDMPQIKIVCCCLSLPARGSKYINGETLI